MKHTWHWSALVRWILTIAFLVVDSFFLLGTLVNVLNGGWVPVVFGAVVLVVMLAWWSGYRALNAYMASHMGRWESVSDGVQQGTISRIPGIGVYLASQSEDVPAALSTQVNLLHGIPEEIVIVTVLTDSVPLATIPPSVREIMEGVKRMTIHAGYMETADIPAILRSDILGTSEETATYYLSERRFTGTSAGSMPGWLEKVFAFLHRNSQTPAAYFGLPEDRVISIGTRVDL
jgi:KUP system potassium uptake protein